MPGNNTNSTRYGRHPAPSKDPPVTPANAEAILSDLAAVFLNDAAPATPGLVVSSGEQPGANGDAARPKPENMYRVLVEQIPALFSSPTWTRGSVKRTSARKSNLHWVIPKKSGSRIRFGGTKGSIRRINDAGARTRRKCV